MKAALVILSAQDDLGTSIRSLLAAARQAGAETIALWVMQAQTLSLHEHQDLATLPLESIHHVIGSAEAPPLTTEEYMPLLKQVYDSCRPDLLLWPAGVTERELSVRMSCRLGGSCQNNIQALREDSDGLVVRRRAYSSNLYAELRLRHKPYCLTVENGSFIPDQDMGSPEIFKMIIPNAPACGRTERQILPFEVAERLSTADRIIVGGRGLGSKSAMQRLQVLSQMMAAESAGTRPAILDGWLPLSQLLGVSGSVAKAQLCLVFGASGAASFIAGIEKSEQIVAINKDPEALIFKHCDIGIIADCKDLVEALIKILSQKKMQ